MRCWVLPIASDVRLKTNRGVCKAAVHVEPLDEVLMHTLHGSRSSKASLVVYLARLHLHRVEHVLSLVLLLPVLVGMSSCLFSPIGQLCTMLLAALLSVSRSIKLVVGGLIVVVESVSTLVSLVRWVLILVRLCSASVSLPVDEAVILVVRVGSGAQVGLLEEVDETLLVHSVSSLTRVLILFTQSHVRPSLEVSCVVG